MLKEIFKLLIYFTCIILFYKIPYDVISFSGICIGTIFMGLALYNHILGMLYEAHKEVFIKHSMQDSSKLLGFERYTSILLMVVINRHKKPIVIACMGFIAYFVVVMKYVLVTFPVN